MVYALLNDLVEHTSLHFRSEQLAMKLHAYNRPSDAQSDYFAVTVSSQVKDQSVSLKKQLGAQLDIGRLKRTNALMTDTVPVQSMRAVDSFVLIHSV